MKYSSKLAMINLRSQPRQQILLNLLIFLTPVLTMFRLSCVTPLTCLILLILTVSNKFQLSKIKFSFTEITFIAWGFTTCFFAAEPLFSLAVMLKITILAVWCKIVLEYYDITPLSLANIPYYALVAGIMGAILIFALEFFSKGIITNLDHNFLLLSHKGNFDLYRLDGGCTFIAALLWIVIGHLLQRGKIFQSCLIYGVVLLVLLYSDSLASVIACILSLLVFLVVRFFPYGGKIVKYGVIVASLSLIACFAFNHNKIGQIITKYPNINYSWAHRLSIYSFFTEKSLTRPIMGNGIRTAKNIELRNEYYKSYQNQLLNPVPVTGANQSHNMALEIWLDTGLIGLLIFMGLIHQFLSRPTNDDLTYQACYFSCFSSYYIIGSISNGAWNTSWVMTAIWLCLMIESVRLVRKPNLNIQEVR